jgi:hypothetical protein
VAISQAATPGITRPENETPIVAIPRALPRFSSNQFATSLAEARFAIIDMPKASSVPMMR